MSNVVAQTLPGINFVPDRPRLVYRTGAALAIGDVCALNLDFAATSGQAMVSLDPANQSTDSSSGYVFGAAIAQTTENCCRILVVAQQIIADNAEGIFLYQGIGLVKQNGANAGEFLVGTNAQVYATPYTLTEMQALSTGLGNVVGLSIEATSGVAVGRAIWDGGAWKRMYGGDT